MTVRLSSRKSTAKTSNTTAKSPGDIVNKVLHYGPFKDGLDSLTLMLKSETSTSIVISGEVGIGKTTLVREALKKCDVISVWISPSHYADDFMALKYIANELKLDPGPSMAEILSDIEERYINTDKKIVMVLPQFEEFCRKKQILLYCLTNLTQHGVNISLIGLTYSLACTEKLEKRVRSRINASFHNLKPPYANLDEYMEFASLLLGGHKLEPSLREELYMMLKFGRRSIRALKRLLIHSYTWENGKMVLKKQLDSVYTLPFDLMTSRLRSLTFSQANLLKMIMFYCYENEVSEFTLTELSEFSRKNSFKDFSSIDHLVVRNAAYLVTNSFLCHTKLQKMIDRNTTLTINIIPGQLRKIMTNSPELDPARGADGVLKKIKFVQPFE